MSKKVLILTAVALAFAASNLQASQIPVSWDGGGDGYSWSDANNWDPNIVPNNNSNTFAVVVDGGEWTGLKLTSDITIDQLDCYGNVDCGRATQSKVVFTLEDINGLTNHGDLEIDSSGDAEVGNKQPIRFLGDVRNLAPRALGTLYLSLVEIGIDDNDGNLYNSKDAEISGGDVGLHNDLINAGLVTTDGDWEIDDNLHNSGDIKLNGIVFTVSDALYNESDGVITGYGKVEAPPFCNKGSLYASGGPLAIVIDEGTLLNTGVLSNMPVASLNIITMGDVNNNGTIEVSAGGGVAFDCNLVNDTNGVVELLGGNLAAASITQTADANFAGFGSITGNVFIEPNGLIQLTGPTNIVGDVTIGTGATLEISDGITLVTGHTTNNGTIHMKGGRIIPQGGITNNGNIIWEPGLYNNIADFNLDGEVNFKDFADFADTWLWQAQL